MIFLTRNMLSWPLHPGLVRCLAGGLAHYAGTPVCRLFLDAVAHAPHCFEHGGRLAQLGPQSAHVRIHCAGVAFKGIPPHVVEQLLAGAYRPGVALQVFEQAKFRRSKI